MAEEFKFKVGADTKEFKKGMDLMQKEIAQTTKELIDLGAQFGTGAKTEKEFNNETGRLNKKLQTTQRALHGMQQQGKGLGSAMSANAIPATQEFSRIIQDAPYGIQGVANNVQQLTAQLGYLSSKTGGTINALKAMGASLIGPAGILLAVSIVTTVLVEYGDEILEFITGTEDAAKAADKLTEALDKQIKKANQLQTLLGSEIALAKKTAVARAKQEGKSEAEIFAIKKKYNEAGIASLEGALSKAREIEDKAFSDRKKAAFVFYRDDSDENKEALDTLTTNYEKATKKTFDIQRDLNRAKANLYIDDLDSFEDSERKKTDALKREIAIRTSLLGITDFRTPTVPKSDVKDIVSDSVSIGDIDGLFAALTPDFVNRIQVGMANLSAKAQEVIDPFTANLATVLGQQMADAFGGIGDLIGDALSGGANAIELNGAKLLTAFGKFLGELGQMAIAYGTMQLALELAKNGGVPGAVALIAAGVGLVAVGKLISNKMAAGPSLGSSVGGGGSSSYSGSTVSGGSVSSGGTYVFEIEGTKLVGVLSNTLARNKSLGGNLSIG